MAKKKTKKTSDVLLTDFDTYLIAEGTHEDAYEKMGSHLASLDGKDGVHFAVWAPNAKSVSIIGDFNDWDSSTHQMNPGQNGIWTLFIPDLGVHTVYKYSVVAQNNEAYDKSDPYGFGMEQRPKTASVVVDLDDYKWGDEEWINQRTETQALDQPMSIYEVHAGSWKKIEDETWGLRYMTYREMADDLLPYVVEMGFTHIELLPITEHPLDASWGYQVLGFYSPTSRFGTPHDLMYFIDQCHQNGIGVILDWVPAHFPKDGSGLNYFDGTHLYSHADPRQGEHQDWGTMIFNYDRNEVRAFLLSNALFWLDKYHFDGLRVDAVASMLYLDYSREDGQWIPNEYGGRENLGAINFLRGVNESVHEKYPGALTIAEESTAWPMVSRPTYMGGLGFSLKWNMGWMHDTLNYMSKDPVYRKYHHNDMTFSLLYAFNENFVLPLSHDEVVHGKKSLVGKMAGDDWQKFANLRAYYAFMWAHPGKKLLFMGCEFGQWQEWNFDTGLQWVALEAENHQGIKNFVQDLNKVYKNEPALYEVDFEWTGFSWVDANDSDNSVFSFIRYSKSKKEFIVVVINFTPVVREGHRIGVPKAGFYKEILNSDSDHYWGGNVGNGGGVTTENVACHGHEQSMLLTIPPLGTVYLKFEPTEEDIKAAEEKAAEETVAATEEKEEKKAPKAQTGEKEAATKSSTTEKKEVPAKAKSTKAKADK